MYWSTSSGKIELLITKHQARIGSHSGDCAQDIAYLRKYPRIRRQLAKLDPVVLALELKEYGAWDGVELADHDANLSRVLWIACGDIAENLN